MSICFINGLLKHGGHGSDHVLYRETLGEECFDMFTVARWVL